MAFILGVLTLPLIMYKMDEASDAMDDIYNFDSKKYIENKMSKINIERKIKFLELELKRNDWLYKSCNEEYKKVIQNDVFDASKLNDIKIKKNYYSTKCSELNSLIKELNNTLNKY
jgi:hypothetical protein